MNIYKKRTALFKAVLFGADNQIRTGDLILTKDALYLLSYISIGRGSRDRTHGTRFWRPMLYQLSYTPVWLLKLDSNQRPCG